MLQVNLIKQNAEEVKRRLALKHFDELNLVDEIISMDDNRKKLIYQFDETKAKINAASKEIGSLMSKGNKEEAEKRKKDVEQLKDQLAPIQQHLDAAEKQLNDLLVRLPNLPSGKVPPGRTPNEN